MGNTLSPGLIATYGPMGSGKSTDLIATCIGDGAYLGAIGGLQVGATSLGVPAGYVEARTMPVQCMEQVPGGIVAAAQAGFRSVGVDDGSLLMKRTFANAQEAFGLYRDKGGTSVRVGVDMAMYGYLDKIIYEIAYTAMHCGIRVYINFHLRDPSMDKKGRYHIGGPELHWKQLTPRIGYFFDLVQRTMKDPERERWDTGVHCDERNPQYTEKNRILDTLTEAPLNTAEMLRESGRHLPRPPGLEWMDEVAESLAGVILSGTPEKEARQPFIQQLRTQKPPKLIRWALRDGTHRARLRRAMSADAILSAL